MRPGASDHAGARNKNWPYSDPLSLSLCPPETGFLLPASGWREVWFTPVSGVQESVPQEPAFADSPVAGMDRFDPLLGGDCVAVPLDEPLWP